MDQLPKLKGITSKKERRLYQNADVLGVCLVAKHAASTGRHTGLRTGSVVRGLYDYSKKKIFLVTSEKIVREEELDDLKRRKNVLNASDYTLYFLSSSDPHSHSEQPKTYQLQDVTNLTNSEEKVIFNFGLVIIPIASEKLSENSGLKKVRPFAANKDVTGLKDLNDSICQIVEGSTKSIDVKSYKIEFIDNECALSLPEKETTHRYKNWTELTADGAITNLHPYGAVILKSGRAVAVLNFVDDKISSVCLSEVQFSECFRSKTSVTDGTDESEREDGTSSEGDSITANIGDPLRDAATQVQPVLHNPENSNAIQPDGDSITANIGDPPRDAATQDQPVLHNPENSNVSQGPDGDSITANIGDPPRDGTPGQLPKYDITIKGNPDNVTIGDKNELTPEAPPRNAATQDRPVRHNPENSNASQEPDGTPGQLPKYRVTIIGHPRNVMIGDHNTLDTRAPPRNVPPSAPDGVSGGETTQSNDDSSSG